LKINLFTPVRQLAEGKLIFFAPLGEGVNEENQSGDNIKDYISQLTGYSSSKIRVRFHFLSNGGVFSVTWINDSC
jgi:hypothetical protein